ncbi:dispanin subfamily A member 2b-like [Micropterus salmoides]|uniref:dispanin subfamily A member 2b-like n=1 Tax=Micropterus salmoides TaxID=27706 RepID=UPI0018EC3CD0|nr:dispanin subfamily A member 2b-like [Micropterus salmoides]
MNPIVHPAEAVPLQGRYDGQFGQFGQLGQPGGPTLVQYTTVNMTTESPKDHIIWSLCCFLYLNPFCLGLAALIFSIKARDRKVVGDLDGAQYYGSTARCLNIWATILGAIIMLISIITMTVIAVKIHQMFSSNSPYNPSYNDNYRG